LTPIQVRNKQEGLELSKSLLQIEGPAPNPQPLRPMENFAGSIPPSSQSTQSKPFSVQLQSFERNVLDPIVRTGLNEGRGTIPATTHTSPSKSFSVSFGNQNIEELGSTPGSSRPKIPANLETTVMAVDGRPGRGSAFRGSLPATQSVPLDSRPPGKGKIPSASGGSSDFSVSFG
jgi:hypothetical protein